MKKYILLAITIFALAAFPVCSAGRDRAKEKPEKLIREFRGNDGFHSINLGRLGTGLARGILKIVLAAESEEDALRICNCFNRISSVKVAVYEECDERIKEDFNRRMNKLLDRYELMLEIKDNNTHAKVFSSSGAYYMFLPSEYVMIRFTGRIDTEALMKIAVENM